MPRALITGVSGQDGWYLSQLLLRKGYEVFGLVRSSTTALKVEISIPGLRLVRGDISNAASLAAAVEVAEPDEVYNLAGFSQVGRSWQEPEVVADATGLGALRLLEAVRQYRDRTSRDVRYYQASSSEMFGSVEVVPQDERTSFHPRSPYGVAKVFAHHMTVNYRESYGMFACSGILFNHESPHRREVFVTRKITRAAARIALGQESRLVLGALDVRRDWGHAADYVDAMWRMLQRPEPDDYVIATGESHTLEEFLALAFRRAGLGDWQTYVAHDPELLRPVEVGLLVGDASKARKVLGWVPARSFEDIVFEMVDADLAHAGRSPHASPGRRTPT